MRIASNREGIGSRLKCLISAMRLAKDVKVFWENTHCCRCSWHDLFENDIETDKNPHVLKLEYPDVIYSWRFDLTQEERARIGAKRIDFLFDKVPADIREGLLTQLKRLVPTKRVQRIINQHKLIFDDSNLGSTGRCCCRLRIFWWTWISGCNR
jgi:hypothetical protein